MKLSSLKRAQEVASQLTAVIGDDYDISVAIRGLDEVYLESIADGDSASGGGVVLTHFLPLSGDGWEYWSEQVAKRLRIAGLRITAIGSCSIRQAELIIAEHTAGRLSKHEAIRALSGRSAPEASSLTT